MAMTYDLLKTVTSQMYARSLRSVPAEAQEALRTARANESGPLARRTLDVMLTSAREAESRDQVVCSDSGIPTYSLKIGTKLKDGVRRPSNSTVPHFSTSAAPDARPRTAATKPELFIWHSSEAAQACFRPHLEM